MKSFSKYYELSIKLAEKEAAIRMEMLVPILRTEVLPKTFTILQNEIPKVLITKCFNEQKLPFRKEVRNTEIGHLFEHILLQNILDLKLALGYKNVVIDGVTEWDWRKEKKGVFHINLNVGKSEDRIISKSLAKTSLITDLILASGLRN